MAPHLGDHITNAPSPTSTSGSTAYPPRASSSRRHPSTDTTSTSPLKAQADSSMQDGQHSEDEDGAFDPFALDPAYRLRTVRTAHSVIAESILSERDADQRKRRRTLFRSIKRKATLTPKKQAARLRTDSDATAVRTDESETVVPSDSSTAGPSSPKITQAPASDRKGKGRAQDLPRREVYVNIPLPNFLLSKSGDPVTRYVRNKVRTSKYTLLTFLPKNLFEQFRRVANVYFLLLVILQAISIFGAAMPQIGMLPLITILGMTAIKDGIEDWRRAQLDNEVNNSATTKLGAWRNVNQPVDPRSWWEKLFGIDTSGPSKGVKRLREREATAGRQILNSTKIRDEEEELADITDFDKEAIQLTPVMDGRSGLLRKQPSAMSMASRKSSGVVDWSRRSLNTAQWERTLWKKLEVGDFVFLQEDDQIPADIIVLSTSEDDGLAFVETKNLDGETNLKIRKALKATATIQSEEDLEHSQFILDSEPPHANLYSYNGVLKYRTESDLKAEKQEAVTINEMLLRGCTLRNTKWVIGIVLFTGADTKIMLNGGQTPSKRSKIEKETNFNVVMNFVILFILCLTTALLHGWYQSLDNTSATYYEIDGQVSSNIYLDSFVIFASCLILFQNIVPASLYITIEIVKTVQAFFIFQDVEMYYDAYDTPCVPKTWNISDDLGQIEYVFSDKTGTLTQNIMEFKKCSVGGVTFGQGMTEAMMGAAKRDGRDVGTTMGEQDIELAAMKRDMLGSMKSLIHNRYLREDKLTLIDPALPRRLTDQTDPLRSQLIEFWRAIAICHSVLADVSKPFEIEYKAESPDEAALVAAARDVGFPFIARNNARIDIEVLGNAEQWIPLKVLEFNSTRKRMSVVVRDPHGRIVMFCKGADSVIYERLAKDHDTRLKEETLKNLEDFANGGLRTLCVAHRYMTEEEYAEWSVRYDAACAAVVDREGEIDKACEVVEHSLTILGATALEDKLQEGVPDAIEMLHRAGIKLWILTGDKLQTAIEIGYSCNLLTNDMEVMIVSASSEAGARAQIEAGLDKIATTKEKVEFAVVIDGESLGYALQPHLKGLFLTLGTQCAAVICCRVSPSQKAQTVKLVKDGCHAMTLSIGDGANDVAMIQEANVGVGLFGLEGSQAAMSADYAFGQFRFLTRLLLVHGRWSYVRIADMHANFFYKNTIWTVSMFWFLIFNSFDATYLYEYTFVLLFNLVFTSLPVGIMGAFDQDTNAKASMAFPQLYKRGIRGLDYTRKRFWGYMADGLYQSAVLFFIPFLAYGTAAPWSAQGFDTSGLYDFGTVCAAAGVASANIFVGVNMRYWTWITAVVLVGSTLLVYIWIPIYSVLGTAQYLGTAQRMFATFSYWAIVIITVFIAVGPRWLIKAIRSSYFPRDKDIVREAWIAGDLKDQLGVPHRKDAARAEAAAEAAKHKRGSMIGQLHRALGDGRREGYQAANTSSPQKEPYGSPFISGLNTPISPSPLRSPGFQAMQSVPTANLLGTSPQRQPSSHVGNVPPPSSPPLHPPLQRPTSPLNPATPIVHPDTPMSQLSYTSPSAIETFNLANGEIRRMTQASRELRRASLGPDTTLRTPSPRTLESGLNRHSSLLVGGNRRNSSKSTEPHKRLSMPITSTTEAGQTQALGILAPSPKTAIEASFDRLVNTVDTVDRRETLNDDRALHPAPRRSQEPNQPITGPTRRTSLPLHLRPTVAPAGQIQFPVASPTIPEGGPRDSWISSYYGGIDGGETETENENEDMTMDFSQSSGWENQRDSMMSRMSGDANVDRRRSGLGVFPEEGPGGAGNRSSMLSTGSQRGWAH